VQWKNAKQNTLVCYIALVVAYLALTLLSPVPRKTLQHYHLTVLRVHLIDLAVVVPLMAIWTTAFYGYYKLSGYAKLINHNADGRAVQKLSRGLLLLALWLPVTSIVSTVFKDVANAHPAFLTPANIVNDYLNLAIPFAGFLYIAVGARALSRMTRRRPSVPANYMIALFIIAVGVVYSHLVTTTQNNLNVAYHLGPVMVLTTLAIPYIFMWYVGLVASYEIYAYQQRVKGVLYGRSLRLLAFGMTLLIFTSMSLQYLTTLSYRLTALSLNWLLAIIYALLIVLAISYVLIAIGTQRLQKIEEV